MTPEEKREYYREYYKAHREERLAASKKYNHSHKAEVNEYKRLWYRKKCGL